MPYWCLHVKLDPGKLLVAGFGHLCVCVCVCVCVEVVVLLLVFACVLVVRMIVWCLVEMS